jgi:hypothetical protein
MKTKIINVTILLVLVLSQVVMALDRLPRPEDAIFAENIQQLFVALLILAFLTPFGWGILALIIIGIILAAVKGAKKAVTADYSVIPDEDKRDMFLEALEQESTNRG